MILKILVVMLLMVISTIVGLGVVFAIYIGIPYLLSGDFMKDIRAAKK